MISGLLVVAVVVLAAKAAVVTSTPAATNHSGGGGGVSNSLPLMLPAPLDSILISGGGETNNKHLSADNVYTNQFVIQVKGGEEAARELAHKHGFVYLNHILADYYHLEHRRLAKRSTSLEHEAETLNISIQDEPQVLHLERQVLKRRVKRDFLELPTTLTRSLDAARARPPNQAPAARQPAPPTSRRPAQQLAAQRHPANQPPARPINRLAPKPVPRLLATPAATTSASTEQPQHELMDTSATSLDGAHLQHSAGSGRGNASLAWQAHGANTSVATAGAKQQPFNDPSWPLMWYLDGGAKNGFDLNVMAAWKMGYTGKGIVITILDDGLEKDHPDLQANYDPLASFDINGDDADPMPRYDAGDSNRHGTRCAGEVAAVPDNNICSIGIAYNSKVGGVRMLDGDVTDAVEARSLGLNNQHIHIYSASWGPDDNGKTVDGPGELATRAFIEGVTNGRQGLGSIFVFASGNGGREHDNCNCDGYTNSIWTLSISSATENGYVPWYIEACSSTLATTYSSGSYEERQIATTDLHHSCTSSHTGTSASAPLAAGICALVLESNPRLTWRDMQHIVVRTAKPANLVAKDWRTNALGRNVSHAFGYGLMDAAAMITMAKRWTTVPVQYTCEVRSPQMDKFIPPKGYIELKLRAECANVRFLEHVQSKVTLTASRRGDLHIYLISPHGTRSTLLAQRPNDQAEQGFRNWPFMTVHSWGESPNGIWTLEVHNDGKAQNRAYLKEWTLILYGTYDDPNKHLDSAASHPQPAAPVLNATSTSTSTRPPGPLPVQHSDAKEPSGQQQKVANSPASHWSFTPPPPPPPPIQQPSTVRPPATTSTYPTTFKTIVSPSSNDRQQQPQQTGAKADFDIVSPATQSPANTLTEAPEHGSTAAHEQGGPILKPPVGQMDAAPAADRLPENKLKTTTPAPPPATNGEVDANQIDSKLLTKDYRSSGDQSNYEQQQVSASQQQRAQQTNNQNHHQPSAATDQSAGLGFKVLSAMIISSLVLHLHLVTNRNHDQIVRPSCAW